MDIPTDQTPYTLRRATQADLDAVTALEAVCFPPTEAADRAAFDWRLRCYAHHFWVLEMGGTNHLVRQWPRHQRARLGG